MKKLHIELTKFGLYVYTDDKNRGTKLSYDDIANDCNILDEEDVKKIVNGFSSKGKVYTFDLEQLVEDAKNDTPTLVKVIDRLKKRNKK